MIKLDLNVAVALASDAGIKTGLHAAHARQVIFAATSDPRLAEALAIQIFTPVAREQIDHLKETACTFGASEEETQVLIYKYGQGLLLGSVDGRPS